jgi:peptide deformylase
MNMLPNPIELNHLCIVPPSHPVLTQVAEEIKPEEVKSLFIQALINKMLEIAGSERGNLKKTILVGLAAPQIGVSKRLILVDTGANGKGEITNVKIYINPKIVKRSEDKDEWYEGCFSTGAVAGIVERSRTITVQALNENGEEVEETHHGYVARIFQHETDHLDGIRFPSLIKDDSKLHWVEKEEYPVYRNNEGWREWTHKCTRAKCEEILKTNPVEAKSV